MASPGMVTFRLFDILTNYKHMKEKIVIYQVLVRLAGNTREEIKPWGSLSENGCGRFNDLDKRFLSEIKSLGANHVWLTGVLEHASCTSYPNHHIKADNPLVVKGVAGSPYAIRDYFDVSPDLADDPANRMQEFEELIARCRQAGLNPIIDFIPNHTARKYYSDQEAGKDYQFGKHDKSNLAFHRDNHFYYIPGERLRLPDEVYEMPHAKNKNINEFDENPAKATGNDCFSPRPSFHDWYETVKLNYGIDMMHGGERHFDPPPSTWRYMLEVILFWASKGVGGFRCDMAEMVPVEFWNWMIPKAKKAHPGLVFIAESYNTQAYKAYREAGFDFFYDKEGFYNTVRNVVLGAPASHVTGVWQALDGLDDIMVRFMENHDEERIASRHFAGQAEAGIPAMALAATMHRGPVMIYFGQETGEEAAGESGYSGDDGKTTIFDYARVPSFQKWFDRGACHEVRLSENERHLRQQYKDILACCQHEVIINGHFYDLMWNNPDLSPSVYAFLRWDGDEIMLIASNFSKEEKKEMAIRIPDHFWELYPDKNAHIWNMESLVQKTRLESHKTSSLTKDGIKFDLPPAGYDMIRMLAAS